MLNHNKHYVLFLTFMLVIITIIIDLVFLRKYLSLIDLEKKYDSLYKTYIKLYNENIDLNLKFSQKYSFNNIDIGFYENSKAEATDTQT